MVDGPPLQCGFQHISSFPFWLLGKTGWVLGPLIATSTKPLQVEPKRHYFDFVIVLHNIISYPYRLLGWCRPFLGLLTAADTQPPVGRGAAKQDPRLWLVDQDPASSLVGSHVGADWEKERSSLSTEICWEGKTFITLALVAKSCFDFSSLKVSRAWCILLQILLIFYFLRVGSCKTGKMADVFFPEGRQGCQAGKVRLKLWILSPPALLQSKFQTLSKNETKTIKMTSKPMQMEKKL